MTDLLSKEDFRDLFSRVDECEEYNYTLPTSTLYALLQENAQRRETAEKPFAYARRLVRIADGGVEQWKITQTEAENTEGTIYRNEVEPLYKAPPLTSAERERLAAYDRAAKEPVAWTDEQELRDVNRDGCGYLFTVNPITPNADMRRVIQLFTAPPLPVVPDEVSWLEAMPVANCLEVEIRNLIDDPTANNAVHLVRSVMEEYRAAMLAVAPQPPAQSNRIVPILPVRDEYGFWRHPNRIETPFDEGGASTRTYEAWFAERGMAVDFTYMNQVFCEDCCYGENVDNPVLHWNPESPYGDGWILTAIFDTEEGPCAEWVRYKSPDGDKGIE